MTSPPARPTMNFTAVAALAAVHWRRCPVIEHGDERDVRHHVDIPFVAECAAGDSELSIAYSLALVGGELPKGTYLDDVDIWTLAAEFRIGLWSARVWQLWDCETRAVICAGDGVRFGVVAFDTSTPHAPGRTQR